MLPSTSYIHTELLTPIDTYEIECDEIKLLEYNLCSNNPTRIDMPLRHIDRSWACYIGYYGDYRTP